jgi:GTP cyclohydrolase I
MDMHQLFTKLLKAIGEDPKREGLKRTPQRCAEAMKFLTSGYEQDLKVVTNGALFTSDTDGMVIVKDIECYSLCEHHMLPFWGTASVACIPTDKIVGLSKIPRIVEVFSRRLQVQERLTRQIVEGLAEVVHPKAVVVRIRAAHMCMMMRGVRTTGSETITEHSVGLEHLDSSLVSRLWKSIE